MKTITSLIIILFIGSLSGTGILAQSEQGLMKTDTTVIWYSDFDLWGNGKPSDDDWEPYEWDTLKWAAWKQYEDPETALDIAGIFARFKAAWNEDYFMVWVDVRDDILVNENENVWDDDGVELFFDMGNDKDSSYDDNDAQYIFGWNDNDGAAFAGEPEYDGIDYYFLDDDDGYDMEMAIPWENMGADGTMLEDSVIGFTIEVSDQDNQPHPAWVTINHRISWSANTTGVFSKPYLMGTVRLVKPGAVTTPVIIPGSMTFTDPITVEISCETPGANIYYTVTGRDPNILSDEYTGPIELDKTTTIKAVAMDNFGNESEIAEATFTYESTGISDDLVQDITLWPNPAANNLSLQLDNRFTGKIEITLLDLSGRELSRFKEMKTNRVQSFSIPINNIQPGHYYINIRMGESDLTRSFIIK